MTPELGDTVWIPCKVTRSAFPDERNVSIVVPDGRWQGVVDLRQLRDQVLDGVSAVRATVVGTSGEHLSARLPGQTSPRQYLRLPAKQSDQVRRV